MRDMTPRRRSEGKRILWFLLFSVTIHVGVSLVMGLLNGIVSTLINEGFRREVFQSVTMGRVQMWRSYVQFLIWRLAEAGTGFLHRGLTFRSRAGWYWTIPALVGVDVVYCLLSSMVAAVIFDALLTYMSADMPVGMLIAFVSTIWSLASFLVWLVISYVFQRFVLYRTTLDTNALAQR